VTINELYKVPEPQDRLAEMLERCKSRDQSLRPSSLSILETACEHLPGHERSIGDSLHELLGSGPGGYLLQALETTALGLDDYADFSNERRRKILNRLELLCKDGAVDLFDKHSESLHLSVLLDRQDKLKHLLSDGKKSDVNKHWPKSGWTPLHLAFQENREHMVSLLSGHGADSEALDRHRRPPKYYRKERNI
jgi:ankyrin repeat protein